MKRAVLLVGHGSKLEGSSLAINQVIKSLQKKDPSTHFQSAYLELQTPSIPDGISECIKRGAEEVIVVPYFVQTGKHVIQDIPKIVSEAQKRYPDKNVILANYLGFDERLASLVYERVNEARTKQIHS